MYAVYRCCWGREVRQGGNLSIRKSRKICGGQGRSGPNGVASSNFVVKGAQVEIHSDRLVTSKIDTILVDFRKIKYKWTPNKAKQNRLYVNYILLSIYVPVSRIKYA